MTGTERMPTLSQLVAATRSLYSPPLVFTRLSDAINHPRTSMQDIARIISEDQGLTARLLKIANSPLYGFSKVDSIQRAVTLIGTREIRDLALAVAVMTGFPKGASANNRRLKNHWRHSISCAVVARNIAFFKREPNVERFFVAGILHNIGRLVLSLTFPEPSEQTFTRAATDDQPLHRIEEEMFGFDHADLGGALLQSWNVPESLIKTVTYHHQPARAPGCKKDAGVIHLADLICQALRWGMDPEIPVVPFDAQTWTILEFPLSGLDTVVTQSELQLGEVLPLLEEPS